MSRSNSQLKPYEISWAAKSFEDRGDVFRVVAMLERIGYLEELRVKPEKDLEFGDAGSTSALSTLDLRQLLVMVEREIVHRAASVERLIGPAPRA